MDASDPCIPWYFPINDTTKSRLCDPWEAREFREQMDLIPSDHCNHCLPDCSATIYQASVTAAPFRRCGYKNLGTSFLCDFEKNIRPPIWGKKVLDQYQAEVSEVPNYIRDKVASNLRRYADPSAAGDKAINFMRPHPAVGFFDTFCAIITTMNRKLLGAYPK